ncbi:hypothetical protein [Bradyrhizobium sp.]|uniref:hypothetical protein n=1 Tax=Bradyrhizobium sp. TaxID=376 RepID=UPI002BBB0A37|nr:hypothetical protein [Bradyrhizobium sp.]HMM91953.1 hypothetical protein [Bradyrhizobium sp.]
MTVHIGSSYWKPTATAVGAIAAANTAGSENKRKYATVLQTRNSEIDVEVILT